MDTYILKVQPEGAPQVWRTIEIREDQTLHDLHRLLALEFDLDDAHLYAFYLSGREGDRETEFGGPRTECPRRARRAKLGRLGLEPGRRILHLFDFGERVRHEVEVVRLGEADGSEDYPRILDGQGEVDRSLRAKDQEGLTLLSQEIRSLLGPSSDEWFLRDKVTAPLDAQLDLARRVHAWGSREELGLEVLEESCELDIQTWLLDLVNDLARAGRVDDAVDLAAGMSGLLDEEMFLSARGYILARAGRREEARDQAEAMLEKFADDPQRIAEAGEVLEITGDETLAEAAYRRALRLAIEDRERREATLRLLPLLRRQGREAEARRLEEDEAALRDRLARAAEAPRPPRSAPKTGRNDPCPCGSGLKHKKCCGGPGPQASLR